MYTPSSPDTRPLRAILVDVFPRELPRAEAERSLGEIVRLVETAGGVVVVRVLQRRGRPSAKTYVGSGKAEEIAELVRTLPAELVIINGTLRASQAMHLGKIVRVPVLDRVEVILAIFAKHARTAEAKLQVELARIRYELPKLYGRGIEFSRLGGGIGTRGPGEQYLEVQKRTLKRKIAELEAKLEHVREVRATQREKRARSALRTAVLVGYTNAGKSSLLRALVGKDVLVADQLFSTLDTRIGRLAPSASHPTAAPLLLADTIGFIENLPPSLIASFRSTLEEIRLADHLLVVVDASDPRALEKHRVVEDVLAQLGADGIPRTILLNKVDAAHDIDALRGAFQEQRHFLVSATQGTGIDPLRTELRRISRGETRKTAS